MKFDDMQIGLDGAISGKGSDDVGSFSISGTMNPDATFTFNKAYEGAHTVVYEGT